MSHHTISLRYISMVGALCLLGACTQAPVHTAVVSSPPPQAPAPAPAATASSTQPQTPAPAPKTLWETISFDTNSSVIDAAGQKAVDDAVIFLRRNPASVATITGKADTSGGVNSNMDLSQKRITAVRDAFFVAGPLAATRVKTDWTAENPEAMSTGNHDSIASNRVVDIAIH